MEITGRETHDAQSERQTLGACCNLCPICEMIPASQWDSQAEVLKQRDWEQIHGGWHCPTCTKLVRKLDAADPNLYNDIWELIVEIANHVGA